jgi:hypothetical protein
MGMGGRRHAPAALLCKRPGIPCTGDRVGPRADLDKQGNLAPTGICSPDHPVRSDKLYRHLNVIHPDVLMDTK